MTDLGNAVANTNVQGFISILALAANVICLAVIIKRSIEQKKESLQRGYLDRNKRL